MPKQFMAVLRNLFSLKAEYKNFPNFCGNSEQNWKNTKTLSLIYFNELKGLLKFDSTNQVAVLKFKVKKNVF